MRIHGRSTMIILRGSWNWHANLLIRHRRSIPMCDELNKLRVELRAAVDALRPFATAYRGAKQPKLREFGDAYNFVAAYDTQHPEPKQNA
jgi:hypothetical protein